MIFQLETNDKRIEISRVLWESLKSLKQTRDQLLSTRDLLWAKEISVVLTLLYNFEIILIITRICQILMFETRTISHVHSINFFTIHYQYHSNLYNVIENFESTISWNEFFKRISQKIRIAIVWVFKWIFEWIYEWVSNIKLLFDNYNSVITRWILTLNSKQESQW